MTFLSEVRELVDQLSVRSELDVASSDLPASIRSLGDDDALKVLAEVSGLIESAERARVVVAGVVAERSTRASGQSGVAQTRGHRTPVALIQSITGATRGEAAKQVRLGTAILEGEDAVPTAERDVPDAPPPAAPWHEPLRVALLNGTLTSAQHDAIFRGLGTPPAAAYGGPIEISGTPRCEEHVREVWTLAAARLLAVAPSFAVEDLLRESRRVRDLIYPEGVAERFDRHYEARSFRMWLDDNGQHRAHLVLDDEGAAWIRSMRDAALRPRRGGPRFMTDQERATAKAFIEDPRSNEQLEYDLFMDTLKAGSLATPEQVFGARQPGVRIVITRDAMDRRDAFDRLLGIGHLEDGGDALPAQVIDRTLCDVGSRTVTVDEHANPLDLGREQRLFSSKQRIALAVRDGGCMFPGCATIASHCEAHHCDHWAQDQGRTDIDRGILLCRFHHLLLHNHGWRILRDRHGPFVLHPPPGRGDPMSLTSKSPLWTPLIA